MTSRLQDNTFKAIILIMLFLGLMLHTVVAGAQSHGGNPVHKGFVPQAAHISSGVTQIPAKLQQAGGEVGWTSTITFTNVNASPTGL